MSNSLSDLTPEQKVGQLFFIGIPGPTVDDGTHSLLEDVPAGGVCLFARNIRDARQTRELNDELRLRLRKPLLSIDQEGGVVDRLRRVMTPMPAANKVRTAVEAMGLARIIAETLLILGFNMDFAPVVDVLNDDRLKFSNGLFPRVFGRSEDAAADLAGSFLATLQNIGVLGCLKHFPGLGASNVDSHEELPHVLVDEAEFEKIDLHPYQALLNEAHAIMIAHAAYPKLSLQQMDRSGKLLPSSLSSNFITTLLRRRLGFDGLVITDDLEMGAIVKNYGIGDACKMAISAGADMLAICADPAAIREGFSAVLAGVESGEIPEERLDDSVARIETVRSLTTPAAAFDEARLRELSAEVEALNASLG